MRSGDLRTSEHLGGTENIETAEESSWIGWVAVRPSYQLISRRRIEKSVLKRHCFLDLFARWAFDSLLHCQCPAWDQGLSCMSSGLVSLGSDFRVSLGFHP